MKFKDLIPFNWNREKNVEVRQTSTPSSRQNDVFDSISDDFDQLFRHSLFGRQQPFGLSLDRSLRPSVNVSETSKDIRIEAELPGLDEKDIDVVIENGCLVLRGEKKQECRDDKNRVHRVECRYGFFERTLPLPDCADTEKSKATYKNGVLRITIPKDRDRVSGKRIPISGG